MKKQILIIKTGATGDVVRTTVLLHAFKEDDITWITARKNVEVLPEHCNALKRIVAIEDIQNFDSFFDKPFDIVLSLDDEYQCVELASAIKTKKLIGAYLDKESKKILYTEDSSPWFDLSLISRFSKETADKMKYDATKSVQEYLFEMVGREFSGEEYLIPEEIIAKRNPILIGIEDRAGARWETKRWNQYPRLSEYLEKQGYQVRFFKERETIREYIQDISECSLVITGDTLGMHFSLALKIPTVAIFTCTSPTEIYDYKRMEKVISPLLWEAFYKTTYVKEAVDAISFEMVTNAIDKALKMKE